MVQEIRNPVVRFFAITVGLTAYVVARTLSLATEYPSVFIWVLAVGAAGGALLTVLNLRKQKEHDWFASLRFTLIVGVVAFAAIFGITWLLSA